MEMYRQMPYLLANIGNKLIILILLFLANKTLLIGKNNSSNIKFSLSLQVDGEHSGKAKGSKCGPTQLRWYICRRVMAHLRSSKCRLKIGKFRKKMLKGRHMALKRVFSKLYYFINCPRLPHNLGPTRKHCNDLQLKRNVSNVAGGLVW